MNWKSCGIPVYWLMVVNEAKFHVEGSIDVNHQWFSSLWDVSIDNTRKIGMPNLDGGYKGIHFGI